MNAPLGWREVSLGEVCHFKYGKSLPKALREGGSVPVFGSNGQVGLHNEALTSGPAIVIGRKGSFGEVNFSAGPCWPIDTTYYVDETATETDLGWLAYRLASLGLNTLNRAAAIPGLNREDAYRQRLLLPPLPEQRQIAKILDKADALRAKRRTALEQLDILTQSIFLDMFGDPIANPMGFPIRALREFYVDEKQGAKCGPFGSALKKSELVSSGVPVWNMDNIDPSGRTSLPFRMWITEAKYRQLGAYSVRDGDVLISRAGTVGKMCVAASGYPSSVISTNLIRVRLGPGLLPVFFVSLMTYCKGRVGRLRTGSDGAFTHMSTGVLDTLTFPYPCLELQERFAAAALCVERQRPLQQRHVDELDSLLRTLQHRAFRGEL